MIDIESVIALIIFLSMFRTSLVVLVACTLVLSSSFSVTTAVLYRPADSPSVSDVNGNATIKIGFYVSGAYRNGALIMAINNGTSEGLLPGYQYE